MLPQRYLAQASEDFVANALRAQHWTILARNFRDIGCEDFAFWLDVLSGGETAHGLQKDLVRYRIVALSRGSSKMRTLRESWDVLRMRPDANFPRDLFHLGVLTARGALKHARF